MRSSTSDRVRTTRSKTRKLMRIKSDPIELFCRIKDEITSTYRRVSLQSNLLDLVDRNRQLQQQQQQINNNTTDDNGNVSRFDRYYRHCQRKLEKLKKPDDNLYEYLYDLYCYLLTTTTTKTTTITSTKTTENLPIYKLSSTIKEPLNKSSDNQQKIDNDNRKSKLRKTKSTSKVVAKVSKSKVTTKKKKKKKKPTLTTTRRYNKSQTNLGKKEPRLGGLDDCPKALFSCTLDSCNFNTKSLASFKVHQQKKHGIQDRFDCKICSKSFKHTKSLDHHLKLVHDSVNVYPCNIDNCEESFTSWELVRKHKIEIHERRNTYECDLCQRVYKTKSSLISHQKVHDDLVCDIDGCGKSFSTKMSFRRHQRLEHRPPEYHCEKCSKTFYEKAQFSKHQKLVDCTWMYCCHIENCTEKYRKLKQLAEHTQTMHQCEPRFVCSWTDCPYSSHSLYLLNNHYRKHTGERPYPCSWPGCDWRFKTMWLLLTHRKIHLNKRNYHCTWSGCTHRSNTSQNFRRHILIHEKNEKLRIANQQQPNSTIVASKPNRKNQSKSQISMQQLDIAEQPRNDLTIANHSAIITSGVGMSAMASGAPTTNENDNPNDSISLNVTLNNEPMATSIN